MCLHNTLVTSVAQGTKWDGRTYVGMICKNLFLVWVLWYHSTRWTLCQQIDGKINKICPQSAPGRHVCPATRFYEVHKTRITQFFITKINRSKFIHSFIKSSGFLKYISKEQLAVHFKLFSIFSLGELPYVTGCKHIAATTTSTLSCHQYFGTRPGFGPTTFGCPGTS